MGSTRNYTIYLHTVGPDGRSEAVNEAGTDEGAEMLAIGAWVDARRAGRQVEAVTVRDNSTGRETYRYTGPTTPPGS